VSVDIWKMTPNTAAAFKVVGSPWTKWTSSGNDYPFIVCSEGEWKWNCKG